MLIEYTFGFILPLINHFYRWEHDVPLMVLLCCIIFQMILDLL